ncbi:hypothetical protein [Jeotgalibacillus marinus]|uniref:Endolytic transglycosylase MltG n=1 Tax=Jeotgalibacillus marinus TaxID=86667 RepID=A0ABV3PZE3_9BACL
MDRRTLRALAAGMVLSALVMLTVDHFTSKSTGTADQDQDSDLVTQIRKERDELQASIDQWENNSAQQVSGVADHTETEIMTRFILVIEPGMTSPEISEQLVQKDIITDANALNNYLADQGLTNNIQTGEYDLNSTQSIEEIAALITRQ